MAKKQKKISLYYKISRKIYGILMICACVLLWTAVVCYSPNDSSFNCAGNEVKNLLGNFGADASDILITFFGIQSRFVNG